MRQRMHPAPGQSRSSEPSQEPPSHAVLPVTSSSWRAWPSSLQAQQLWQSCLVSSPHPHQTDFKSPRPPDPGGPARIFSQKGQSYASSPGPPSAFCRRALPQFASFFGSHYFCFSREASGKCGVHTSFFLDSAGGGSLAASQASETHARRSSSEEGAGLAGREPALLRPSGSRTV